MDIREQIDACRRQSAKLEEQQREYLIMDILDCNADTMERMLAVVEASKAYTDAESFEADLYETLKSAHAALEDETSDRPADPKSAPG